MSDTGTGTGTGAATDDGSPLKIGHLIDGKYQIEAVLGHGGMGIVYLVRQTYLDKLLALKLLDSTMVSAGAGIRRFQQEAKAVSALDHPNLISLTDFGLLGSGQPYLVMDHVKGVTLSQHLRDHGPIQVEQMEKIFAQLCFALASAHASGVVHRDLKPNNIMLLPGALAGAEASVKIIDFGIAKLATDNGDMHKLTKTGEIFGSPGYMSPEQCDGLAVDHRTDIYSLGCVLFEALTGSPPFYSDSALKVMLMHQTGEIPTLREASLGRSFPASAERVVRKMLAKAPSDRYSDASLAALDFANAGASQFVTTGAKQRRAGGGVIAGSSAHRSSAATVGSFFDRKLRFTRLQLGLALAGSMALSVLCAQIMAPIYEDLIGKSPSVKGNSSSGTVFSAPSGAVDVIRSGRGSGITARAAGAEITGSVLGKKLKSNAFLADDSAEIKALTPGIPFIRGAREFLGEDGGGTVLVKFPPKPIGAIAAFMVDNYEPKTDAHMIMAQNQVELNKAFGLTLFANLTVLDTDKILPYYRKIDPKLFDSVEMTGGGAAFMHISEEAEQKQSRFLTSTLAIVRKWKRFKCLKLNFMDLTKNDVEALDSVSNMRYLTLSSVSFGTAKAEPPKFVDNLVYFKLDCGSPERFIDRLVQAQKLKMLDLVRSTLDPDVIAKLIPLKSLRYLALSDPRGKSEISDLKLAAVVTQMQQLEKLRIAGCPVTSKFLKAILKGTQFKVLIPDTNRLRLRDAGINDPRVTYSDAVGPESTTDSLQSRKGLR